MKASKTNLLSALELPCSIAGRRQSLPILNCVHLEAKDGILTIKGSDLDQLAIISCECEGDLEPLCVKGGTLATIVGYGKDLIELSVTNGRLVCKNGATVELPILASDEFPPDPESKIKGRGVNCGDLAKAIRAVKWAASKEEARYMLQSVHVLASAKLLVVESTTGRELAHYALPAISAAFECVIPSAMASHLADCLDKNWPELWLSENWICAKFNKGSSYYCKQLEGNYPNTAQPRTGERILLGDIARDEWVAVLRNIVSGGSDDASKTVRIDAMLRFGKKECAVTVNEKHFKFDDSIPGKFTAKEASINCIPFLKCLDGFPPESTIRLSWIDSSRAFAMESGNLLVITSQPMTK